MPGGNGQNQAVLGHGNGPDPAQVLGAGARHRQVDLAFQAALKVTGIVLAKLDGTARGGILVAVQDSLGIPVRFVGLGEGVEDLEPFDPEAFVDGLLGGARAA